MRAGSEWGYYIDALAYPSFVRVRSFLFGSCHGSVPCGSVISPCVREGRVGLHERGTWVGLRQSFG